MNEPNTPDLVADALSALLRRAEAQNAALLAELGDPDEGQPATGHRRLTRLEMLARGIPKEHVTRVLRPTPTDAVASAQKWARGTDLFLVLEGATGTGKSLAAAHIVAWTQIEEHRRAAADAPYFVTGAEYVEAVLRKDYHVIDRVRACSLLALDELGRQYDRTGFGQSKLDELIATRKARCARTIITTNVEGAGLHDATVQSRVLNCGTWCRVQGPDLRAEERRRRGG